MMYIGVYTEVLTTAAAAYTTSSSLTSSSSSTSLSGVLFDESCNGDSLSIRR